MYLYLAFYFPNLMTLLLFLSFLFYPKSFVYAENESFPEFIKVNSGTRASIRSLFKLDSSTYFLSDKIFCREDSIWQKLDLPLTQNISLFFPVAKNDLWITINTELNTTDLFHYTQQRIEKIRSPFANEISSWYFSDKNHGILAGWGEIAMYLNGKFSKFAPPPTLQAIVKVYGNSQNSFWLLSSTHELFVFEKNNYRRILPGEQVLDFCFIDNDHGFVLCKSGIFEINNLKPGKIFITGEFEKAKKLAVLDNNNIWVIGEVGSIWNIQHGILKKTDFKGKENLNYITVIDQKEIWILGENGLILYSGHEKFPEFSKNKFGFSKERIYGYGGMADDEYGVAIADFNCDNKLDIYTVCIFNPGRLYINYFDAYDSLSPPRFRDEAIKRGATGFTKNLNLTNPSELHLGVAVADVDNDGDQDIYLCSLNGKNKLLINDGKGFFRDVSDQNNRACEDLSRSNTASFADVDNDGDLDLFVTSEKKSNKLYINDGTGHFTDVTKNAGLSSFHGGMCSSFVDIDQDGLVDLCVSFWFSGNKLYHNETRNGHINFRDITLLTDLSKAEPSRSNAVAFADVDNDGFPDLFISHRQSPNKLYLNDGHGLFQDASKRYFNDKTFLSNGAVFADFDLDGYQDLYLTNVGENVFYKNMGGKRFKDLTSEVGAELTGYCTGCAAGDIDNDGDPDLYVANYINGNSVLFTNNLDQKNSVRFMLTGTKSNRDAIGAKIYLYKTVPSSGRKILACYQEINGGSGYGSVSAKEILFGISPDGKYTASVQFPASGKTIEIENIHPGDIFQIHEETGFAAYRSLAVKATQRFFFDRENQIEIFKYLIVLGFITLSIFIFRKRRVIQVKVLSIIYFLIFILFIIINQALLFEPSMVSVIVPPGLVIVCLVLLHLFSERIRIKKNAEKDKQKVRESISRDLHDDLASTLGSISIYSNTLNKQGTIPAQDQHDISGKITELSHSALQAITDIIWMTSPRNDSLKSLLSKIRNYYFDLFNDNQIRFSADIESPETDNEMKDPLRQNVFLILKETAANIIRHSKGDLVTLKVYCEDGCCHIKVKDNGQGFNPASIPGDLQGGNGLINMHRRAAESGIIFDIQTEEGKGTQVNLFFKMT